MAFADVDGYAHRSGFPLDFDDQLRFNRRLATLARSLALSPGLVNDVPQVAALAPDFDFTVNEECVRLRQCAKLLPFTDAGKPVLHVEYAGSTADFFVTTVGYGFASMRKQRELDAWRDAVRVLTAWRCSRRAPSYAESDKKGPFPARGELGGEEGPVGGARVSVGGWGGG